MRILDGGTGAVTRVLVESRDGTGERWSTIGVSANIIDASFEALYEFITYKLLKRGGRRLGCVCGLSSAAAIRSRPVWQGIGVRRAVPAHPCR